jgi:anti-anti-sigma regulatory factor
MRVCRTDILEGDIWQLSIDGPCLDAGRVNDIRTTIHEAISKNARAIVIDIERVERFDPLGLAGLTSLPGEFALATRVVLSGLRGKVQETAMLLHLHELFDIYADTRAAWFDLNAPIEAHRGCENDGHD